jgi:hypothetical protein
MTSDKQTVPSLFSRFFPSSSLGCFFIDVNVVKQSLVPRSINASPALSTAARYKHHALLPARWLHRAADPFDDEDVPNPHWRATCRPSLMALLAGGQLSVMATRPTVMQKTPILIIL